MTSDCNQLPDDATPDGALDPLDVPLAFPEIVAFYQKSIDLDAIRENLKLTPTQRLAKLQARMDALHAAESC